MNKQEVIKEIKNSVAQSAENARMNASYAGSWGDGGASEMEEHLKYWLDGIKFSETGKTSVYRSTLKRIEEESDPEYIEFKRLQEKFGEIK